MKLTDMINEDVVPGAMTIPIKISLTLLPTVNIRKTQNGDKHLTINWQGQTDITSKLDDTILDQLSKKLKGVLTPQEQENLLANEVGSWLNVGLVNSIFLK
jgi:hypothetical protein